MDSEDRSREQDLVEWLTLRRDFVSQIGVPVTGYMLVSQLDGRSPYRRVRIRPGWNASARAARDTSPPGILWKRSNGFTVFLSLEAVYVERLNLYRGQIETEILPVKFNLPHVMAVNGSHRGLTRVPYEKIVVMAVYVPPDGWEEAQLPTRDIREWEDIEGAVPMLVTCTCEHQGQDARYGDKKRLAHVTHKRDNAPSTYRCTTCGKEYEGAGPV